jgi:predicted transcriptional regulator
MRMEKRIIDWEAVERDYRAGVKTLREIAAEHGITDTAVRKRAKRDDWVRDLSKRISAKAEALVRKQAVRKKVRKEFANQEQQIIEANAQAIVDIRLSHRKDIALAKGVVSGLLEELTIAERAPETLTERSRTAKTLSDALSTLIDKERQAFNIDARNGTAGDGFDSRIVVEFVPPRVFAEEEA